MRERETPLGVTIDDAASLTDTVFATAAAQPDLVVIRRRIAGAWADVSAGRFAAEVTALAGGLASSGIGPGDRVALMAKTRYEWTLVDYALWTLGAVTVPVYETSSAEQVEWILGDAGAVAAVVETDAHADVVASVGGRLPALRQVWRIEAGDLDRLAAPSLSDAGTAGPAPAARADDPATVIYTSGTTGRPKGCVLTHRNLLARARPVPPGLERLFGEGGSTLLFLPLAHIFARVVQIGALEHRVVLGHTADIRRLLDDLAAFRPTFVLAVPRVFEKVYTGARQRAYADGHGGTFDRAAEAAIRYSESLDAGRVGALLRLRHAAYDRLVYQRLRAALGGEVKYAVSGGAPLGERLGHFFRGAGVTILDGYGLTETAAGATVNLPQEQRIGTVGRPIPGAAIRIADDGEILVRGPFVTVGYWHDETATADALRDGWFHTGDLGRLDDDGYLTITGRKKDIIVTAAGKNVAPAGLEDRVRAHPLVSQCVVVGDGRPYVAALVTLDPEGVGGWYEQRGAAPVADPARLGDDPALVAAVQDAVDDANRSVSQAESIRRFRILADDLSEETGELTPTLKVKRDVVLLRRAADIAELYGPADKS